eukprot:gene43803-53567_t
MQAHRSGLPRRVVKSTTQAEGNHSETGIPAVNPGVSSAHAVANAKPNASPMANKALSSSLRSTGSSNSVDGKTESRSSISSESAASTANSSLANTQTTAKKPVTTQAVSHVSNHFPPTAVKEGKEPHETTPVKSRKSLDGTESILSSSPGSISGAASVVNDGNDHIKVVVRVRPLVKEEREDNIAWCWDKHRIYNTPRSVRATSLADHNPSTLGSYAFDRVYDPESTNEDIFEETVRSVVTACMEGYHGGVFCYGQTSTGKTFTMTGGAGGAHRGIIGQAVQLVFETI